MADLIVVGDRVLIEPQTGEDKTETGLVLPASVSQQGDVLSGRVVKTGPGYLTQNPEYSESETWKESETPVRYLPLQAEPGDFAFFVGNEAVDLRYEDTSYTIVPHNAILALVRGDDDAPEEEASDTTIDDLEDLWDEDE
jgi:co-chaperonin GroES (HSP10)